MSFTITNIKNLPSVRNIHKRYWMECPTCGYIYIVDVTLKGSFSAREIVEKCEHTTPMIELTATEGMTKFYKNRMSSPVRYGEWKYRHDYWLPYQDWCEFDPNEFVEVANTYGDVRQGYVKDFWWGYETDMGSVGEGVITKARRVYRNEIL